MIAPDTLFALSDGLALAAWVALGISLFIPVMRPWTWRAAGAALPALFAVAYVGSLAAGLAAGGGGGFGSIEQVRTLFANDHALTAGWLHYLAFDLIVGTLIARDGSKLGLNPLFTLPALVLTFLFGPAGLLVHLIVRTAAAGRRQEVFS